MSDAFVLSPHPLHFTAACRVWRRFAAEKWEETYRKELDVQRIWIRIMYIIHLSLSTHYIHTTNHFIICQLPFGWDISMANALLSVCLTIIPLHLQMLLLGRCLRDLIGYSCWCSLMNIAQESKCHSYKYSSIQWSAKSHILAQNMSEKRISFFLSPEGCSFCFAVQWVSTHLAKYIP